ncbi:MAG: hypothetical protein JNL88_09865 [Bacteroidia bacterium]|nr:hypothetical protein [Bacteroidia bacterium]
MKAGPALRYLTILLSLLFACKSPKSADAGKTKANALSVPPGFVEASVIDSRGFDGCGFLLMKTDSSMLEPISLDSSFMKDQLPVWVRIKFLQDRMSICMRGSIVEILEIRKAGE